MTESHTNDSRLFELDHKGLHALIGELSALAPEPEQRDEWLSILTRLRRRLEAHFLREEQDDSFLQIVRDCRPNDVHLAVALMEDHRPLREELCELVRLGASEEMGDLVARAARFVGHLKEHEASENELLVEALSRDDGCRD